MNEPRYIAGQQIEFLSNRYQDPGDEYMDYDLKYRKGQKGTVISSVPVNKKYADNKLDEYEDSQEPTFIYTIQTCMTKTREVPEFDIYSPHEHIDTKVEQILAQKEEKKKFKDTEGRIGGSRKEMMAYKMILSTDLTDIEKDAATARALIQKDKVYPKVDVAAAQDQGYSSGSTYLRVKLRESMGNKRKQ